MTKKEKAFFRRYFRLHSGGKDGSALILFEKLVNHSARNENYDEKEFKKYLSGSAKTHLPVIKNNLYNLILKSMHEYKGGTSNEDKVKELIEQHDILFSRSLLKQSESALKKAKKIAEENEMFLQLYAILNSERILARYMLDVANYDAVVERVSKEHAVNLEKIKNLTEMNDLGSRFTSLLQKYPTALVREESVMKEIKEIIKHPLLEDESKMLSDNTLRRFYNIKVVAAQWKKDNAAALVYAMKYAEIVEKDLHKNKSQLHDYIISMNSVLTASIRAGDNAQYEIAYEKLNSIKTRMSFATERDKLEATYCLGMAVFTSSADNYRPERGEKLLIEAELNFKQYEKELSVQQRIVWYFVIARMCFALENYETAGKWLNRLIVIPNIDLSEDYQCYARIMNLITAYESGHPDQIEHALRNTYYFLTKRNKVYMYEKIILKYVRDSFQVKTQKEIDEMLVFMHRELKEIHNDPFEENAFDAFNILDWLEKKIR